MAQGSGSRRQFGSGIGPGNGGDPTLQLLTIEEVREELNISLDQQESLLKLGEQAQQRPEGLDPSSIREMGEEERTKIVQQQIERMKKLLMKLEEVLLPAQWDRLKEISIQNRGLNALQDRKIQKELGFSPEQLARFEKVRGGMQDTMQKRMQELPVSKVKVKTPMVRLPDAGDLIAMPSTRFGQRSTQRFWVC